MVRAIALVRTVALVRARVVVRAVLGLVRVVYVHVVLQQLLQCLCVLLLLSQSAILSERQVAVVHELILKHLVGLSPQFVRRDILTSLLTEELVVGDKGCLWLVISLPQLTKQCNCTIL